MNRKECLDAAAAAVLKDRQKLYGTPEDGFAGIAAIWSVLLGRRIEKHEVALCLAALKLVRATNSPGHADNWADLAGYAACGAELATPPEQLEMHGLVNAEQAERMAARKSRIDLTKYVGPIPADPSFGFTTEETVEGFGHLGDIMRGETA